MNEPTNRELAHYVLGTTSTNGAEHVKTALVGNEELAAKISFLQEFTGTVSDPTPGLVTPSKKCVPISPHPVRSWTRRAAIFFLIFLVGGGLAAAGWKLIVTPPLFKENFNRNWVDIRMWETPRRSVFFEDGHARLFDCGYLVTRQEYAGPYDIRFRWKWIDLTGDVHYRDELIVAIHTQGVPLSQHSFEATDGIAVRLNATSGNFRIDRLGTPYTLIRSTPPSSFPLAADQWYDVRITDDGETVSLYVTEHGRDDASKDRPVLQVKVDGRGPGHHIAFYNRDRIAAASHESWIDDVEIYRFDPQNMP